MSNKNKARLDKDGTAEPLSRIEGIYDYYGWEMPADNWTPVIYISDEGKILLKDDDSEA